MSMRRKTFTVAATVVCAVAIGSGTPRPGQAPTATSGTASTAYGDDAERLTIDHLILGTRDLDWAVREFTRLTGVAPQRGGRHPAAGTQNALVSLGTRTYLEILSPARADDSVSASSDTAASRHLLPVGWAISTTDITATAERLRALGYDVTSPAPGSRVLPDGNVLRWQTIGLIELGARFTPFFIQWDAGSPHPAATSPAGCSLESVEIVEPNAAPLNRLLAVLGIAAEVRSGPTARMRVTVACLSGRVVFGS